MCVQLATHKSDEQVLTKQVECCVLHPTKAQHVKCDAKAHQGGESQCQQNRNTTTHHQQAEAARNSARHQAQQQRRNCATLAPPGRSMGAQRSTKHVPGLLKKTLAFPSSHYRRAALVFVRLQNISKLTNCLGLPCTAWGPFWVSSSGAGVKSARPAKLNVGRQVRVGGHCKVKGTPC